MLSATMRFLAENWWLAAFLAYGAASIFLGTALALVPALAVLATYIAVDEVAAKRTRL
ncbi:MAG: hypothetical protein JOZ92_04815 [Candidatus Dormibacteraeota bacterium]|nr:hypothetical protein [Candidatus Dormibacteraeota bacterium]